MGNYASCALAKVPGGARSAKVILPDGQVRHVHGAATAAELMLEAPGHFLADARAMHPGRRLSALAADQELELGAVYVTFPMKRVNSPAAAADMARLLAVATKEARRSGTARVRPDAQALAVVSAPEPDTDVARGRLDDVDDAAAAAEIGEFKHRLSGGRSRRPTLETIEEENYSSRS